MAVDAPKANAADPAEQMQSQLVAQMPETAHTHSRPVGPTELWYAFGRQGGGMSDPGTVLSIVCTGGHTITNDEVVLACATLRLRHPLLASCISFVGKPHFVVNTPLTPAHALRTAREQVEFHTFDDQEKAVTALRDRWLAFNPDDALDVRVRTCGLWWGRHADAQTGKYVLGIISMHAVTDNRRRLNLARCFLELLANPGQAQAELDAHFSGKTVPAPIPPPTEEITPELSDDETDIAKAKVVYDDLVTQYSSRRMSGIVADGPVSPPWTPRIRRKVWSTEETARILRACKEHGVTITHLVNVAGALSTLQGDQASASAPTTDDDTVYFEYMQPIDVTAKIPAQAERTFNGPDMEVACRVEVYPVLLRVPRASIPRVWEVAQLFRERNAAFVRSPHFWRMLRMYLPSVAETYAAKLAGRPALPFMSSLGDLKTVLPSLYPVRVEGAPASGQSGAEICITDNWTTGRIDPFSLVYHLFTFDGRLYLQFRYNTNRTSDALIEPWFNRLVDMVSRSVEADS